MERLTGWELADPGSIAVGGRASPEDRPPVAADAGVWRLTPEQEHAIARRGEPLLLAAGAGSGKTSVLVERFVRAVREDGIAPERILAITFTERAAGELRERVRARLLALGEHDAAHATEGAYVGTFHGFCARVLRAHAREAGLPEEHEILDEGIAGRLRRQAFADALGEFVRGGRAEAVDLIAAYTADRARATVLGVYVELRSQGQSTPRLPTPRLGDAPPGSFAPGASGAQAELDTRAEREAQSLLDAKGVRAVALWGELLERFGERYEAAKRDRDGLDFDDLELRAGELLSWDADVRRAWTERFELLMVDELQDVNPRQLALVRMLERENLFTVGDEWQSIYGFRHADVSLFRARDAQLGPRGQSLRLMHNFRGRSELLEAVNAVFVARFGETFTPLRAGRESSREHAAHGEGAREHAAYGEPLIELLLTDRRGWKGGSSSPIAAGVSQSGAPPWREAEARALAERVGELVRDGRASPGGVAVLLRGTGDIDCYEQALREQGLRTVASAGAFWARQEVADLLAYLRALADPLDEVGLYGALAAPPVRLSSDGLALLARAAQGQDRAVWEIARGAEDGTSAGSATDPAGGDAEDRPHGDERERAAAYCAWLEQERELAGELTLAQLLERAIEHGGLRARLCAHEDGERRLANVDKLVALAQEWERSEGRDLRGFLDEVSFQQGAGGRLASAEAIAEPDAPVPDEARDAVRLMSVHAAKGLEFDVVCVADLGRAPSTGVPDLLVEARRSADWESRTSSRPAEVSDRRIGVRLVELEDPEPRPALQYSELADERREAQAREEDRIVYVAMTRARERLLLSGSCDFASWPRERPGAPPIAWLGPALAPELPALCAEAVRVDLQTGTDFAAPDRAAVLAPALTVDGTDVPLRCRLNVPGTPA